MKLPLLDEPATRADNCFNAILPLYRAMDFREAGLSREAALMRLRRMFQLPEPFLQNTAKLVYDAPQADLDQNLFTSVFGACFARQEVKPPAQRTEGR
jgi:hypothetical protein